MAEIENDYAHCRQELAERLREAAPGRIQILTGPRQVGKTTLLLELAEQFGDQAVYAAGDDPNAALPGFWERCWADTEARAKRGTRSCCSTKYIRSPTGPPNSKAIGIVSVADIFPFM